MSRQDAAPLHRDLPWFGFATQSTALTKGGGLLAAARLSGAPFECRGASGIDYAALRRTQALKSLDPGWRVRWHVRKRHLESLP